MPQLPLAPLTKNKNRITTKQIWIIVTVSVVALLAVAAILLWIFGVFDTHKGEAKIEPVQEVAASEEAENEEAVQEEKSEETPKPIMQSGPVIKDEALREGIILTLEQMGETVYRTIVFIWDEKNNEGLIIYGFSPQVNE